MTLHLRLGPRKKMKLKVLVVPVEAWPGLKGPASPIFGGSHKHSGAQSNNGSGLNISSSMLAGPDDWSLRQTPHLLSPADSHSTLPGLVPPYFSSTYGSINIENQLKKFILIIPAGVQISRVKNAIQDKYTKLYLKDRYRCRYFSNVVQVFIFIL